MYLNQRREVIVCSSSSTTEGQPPKAALFFTCASLSAVDQLGTNDSKLPRCFAGRASWAIYSTLFAINFCAAASNFVCAIAGQLQEEHL